MESRENMDLIAKSTAYAQNVVSDLDSVVQSTANLHGSLAEFAQFLEQTNLQKLSPLDSKALMDIARSVQKFSGDLNHISQQFKNTKYYV